jgi:hypothetical protein
MGPLVGRSQVFFENSVAFTDDLGVCQAEVAAVHDSLGGRAVEV